MKKNLLHLPKEKVNFSKIIIEEEGGEGWLFCGEFRSLLSKLIFTHSALSIKQNGFQLVTRGFELVTCAFELVDRGFELGTCGFELRTRGFKLVTRGFELALLNFHSCFWISSCAFKLSTRNS